MASWIVFSSSGSGGKADRLKVTDDPDAVVEKLSASKTGFADFSPINQQSVTVWVNRDEVRMVRASTEEKRTGTGAGGRRSRTPR